MFSVFVWTFCDVMLQDSFLLSKMDKDFFVDVCVIAGFKMMKQLTTDVDLIMSSVKGSDKVHNPFISCNWQLFVKCFDRSS